MCDVCVIGGGAAGIMTAIKLSAAGLKVTILEKSDKLGKKLLLTGSGKCNILNKNARADSYSNAFPDTILSVYMPDVLTRIFEKLGIQLFFDDSGRAYPVSESSASVLNALCSHLAKNSAAVKTNFEIRKISIKNSVFYINDGEVTSKHLVFATGSPATVGFDSLHLLENLGHRIKPFTPSLCPIYVDKKFTKPLKNMRIKAQISLGDFCEQGELQFKDDALSGIAIFQISELLNRLGKMQEITVDLLPFTNNASVLNSIASPAGYYGLFHPQTIRGVKNIPPNNLKNLKISPIGLYPMKHATIAHGGLVTTDFDNKTLRSLLVDRLYAVGEALDVSGLSGGYNLMWAWASALTVADSIIHNENR